MSLALDVSPWDVQIGDRILGTDLIVSGKPHAITSVKADGVEYTPESVYGGWGGVSIPVGKGFITRGADRKVSIIRYA